MAEVVKETIVTKNTPESSTVVKPIVVKATNTQTISYVIYFLFGVLEILLAFRLVFKFMGASSASGFVRMIYGLTGVFIAPFEGIFRRWFTQGVETTSVFEPSTLVALVVYAVLAWGIVKLAQVLSGEQPTE